MKKLLIAVFAITVLAASCSGRSKEEQKAYTDSLFNVITCSPTIVRSSYTLEDQLNACDLLIEEYPEKKDKIEKIKKIIQKQIADRDSENLY